MAKRKAKKATVSVEVDDGKIKVFVFMINPHVVRAVTRDGEFVTAKGVNGTRGGKEYAMGEEFYAEVDKALAGTPYNVEWIDEPANDQRVIDACWKEEQKKKDNVEVPDGQESSPSSPVEEPSAAQEPSTPPPTEEPAGNNPESAPSEEDGATGDPDQTSAGPEAIEPKKAANNLKTEEFLEVMIDDSEAYSNLSKMVQDLENLKNESAQNQAQYNKDIKDMLKAVFAAARGKAFKSVKCTIAYNFTDGVKTWYRTDTHEAVKTLDMTDKERQCDYADELLETVSDPAAAASSDEDSAEAAAEELDIVDDDTNSDENDTESDENESELDENETKTEESEAVESDSEDLPSSVETEEQQNLKPVTK